MFSIKVSVLVGAAIVASAMAPAQEVKRGNDLTRMEVAIGYSYMRANATPGQCGCFELNGGSMELAVHVFPHISGVFDLTGVNAGVTSIPGQSLSLLTYSGGPRFSYPLRLYKRARFTPFVQGLVGAVHGFDAPFPNGYGSTSSSATRLAVLMGGGLDVYVGHKLAIRALQADYGLTRLPNNANDSQDLLRLSTGIVFTLR